MKHNIGIVVLTLILTFLIYRIVKSKDKGDIIYWTFLATLVCEALIIIVCLT